MPFGSGTGPAKLRKSSLTPSSASTDSQDGLPQIKKSISFEKLLKCLVNVARPLKQYNQINELPLHSILSFRARNFSRQIPTTGVERAQLSGRRSFGSVCTDMVGSTMTLIFSRWMLHDWEVNWARRPGWLPGQKPSNSGQHAAFLKVNLGSQARRQFICHESKDAAVK